MARPKADINPDEVYKLAQLGCKQTEIAEYLGVSTDTLQRRFAAEMDKGSSELKMSLRRWQLESAKKGNVAMLIWLGKQMLGQRDVNALQISNDDEKGFTVVIKDYQERKE